jgi:hypothetical protein
MSSFEVIKEELGTLLTRFQHQKRIALKVTQGSTILDSD